MGRGRGWKTGPWEQKVKIESSSQRTQCHIQIHVTERLCVFILTVTSLNFSPCDRPRVIESLRGVEVVDIAAGGAHSACITASGELFTWGKGRYGRLGHGDSEDQLKPKLVSDLLA